MSSTVPDDDGRGLPSPGTTPTYRQNIHRSASLSSAWSTDAPHHNQGTSYFPPHSPTPRRVPYRSVSAARSSSLNSEPVPVGDGEDSQDDNGMGVVAGDRKLQGPDRSDGDDDELAARQFTEDDPLTVKDRQSLMNVDHPFGLPIWKPALYKKSRTVNRNAETALHATPTPPGEKHWHVGNISWTVLFGWWLGLVCLFVSVILFLTPGGRRYSSLIFGLGWYLAWPFGKYVEGDTAEDEDEEVTPAAQSPGHASVQTIRRIEEVDEEDTSTNPQSRYSTVTPRTIFSPHAQSNSWNADERTALKQKTPVIVYGSTPATIYPSSVVSSSKVSRDSWLSKAIFWLSLVIIIAPLMLVVCLVCWFLVFTVPMAKLNWALLKHMFERPNNIRFCAAPPAVMVPSPPRESTSSSDDAINTMDVGGASHQPEFTLRRTRLSAGQAAPSGSPSSTVLLCTYRAVGLQYYKYTVGGVNIFFVNLMAVVFFAILDGLALLPLAESYEHSGRPVPALLAILTSRALIFLLSLASVIPLSYFIGMAVASISAQSSIGMGAVINATFGSIIEIILYAIALTQGKGRLVEGSIVGSLLAGVLLMPGMSMCSGALRKKEQRFNAKSAGVTSTMLIMAIIGTLTPTLFYQTYGNFQLVCEGCPPRNSDPAPSTIPWVCEHCYYEHPDPIDDPFYQSTVKTLMYFCAAILLFSYLIGLWFSLRTHASQIWQNPQQLMHPLDVSVPSGQGRMSIYHRLVQAGLTNTLPTHRLNRKSSNVSNHGSPIRSRSQTPAPRDPPAQPQASLHQQQAPAGTMQPSSPVAVRRVSYAPNPQQSAVGGPYTPFLESVNQAVKNTGMQRMQLPDNLTTDDFTRAVAVATVSALTHQQANAHSPARLRGPGLGGGDGHEDGVDAGGHDAPSWSRTTSASVLLACTALYAMIAEILVDVVDVVLDGSGIDEKFLGVTLFALVPNTTEFMNAMSFAMNGNIALSMEIGSAYALQVCLLQIPAMVAFSAWYDPRHMGTVANTFTLIFPRWDVIAIILSIFLLTYTYIEAKSNYHRGSILILSYIVLVAGFYFAPPRSNDSEQDTFNYTSLKQIIQLSISSLWAP
ncbi:hypothetical protein BD410DRAFT_537749 [Rickenella mellea]|uniref:Calcium permease n=1 Tax=Rickenella mellea TaxID=50990 RepID=A0A4Y7PRP1_9AGAM|nr:hypothetical protein BD410DRAFT_537749 [Rickenella mellea]